MSEPQVSPFERLGPAIPNSPVVLAVPHAGRIYPPALIEAAAISRAGLESLEDRYADALVGEAVARGATAFVARHARAWIDLNRDEREIDPHMIEPAQPRGPLSSSSRVRGGLGLIPRRLPGGGEILNRRLSPTEVEARIRSDHRPWHAALERALLAARARFGIALLVDCHSMPPLSGAQGHPPRVVIGDRHGRSAATRFVNCAMDVAARAGLHATRNSPYSGAYTLERHGRPGLGIHAMQVEIDRTLYLTSGLRQLGPKSPRIAALIAELADAVATEALATISPPLAAE